MKIIKTIDLWTEQFENQYECFNGAFIDGIKDENIPFDTYKIILHCNCKISVDKKDIFIGNKHQAIVFYKNGAPVRLVVAKERTDITKCITNALNQNFGEANLKALFEKNNISSNYIDMAEVPVYNGNENVQEMDVGSCDRWALLYNMLKGSYTESDSPYGNFTNDRYEFIHDIRIKYELILEDETFLIEHKCAFVNEIGTRLIPIQENSLLTK